MSIRCAPSRRWPTYRAATAQSRAVSDPYVLVLAILCHDLGKVAGEVHVEESVRLTRRICQRIGISEEDTERISFLVEHHVLMTTISQYRDTDDPEIVQSFAETMKTEQRLRELFLLSYADLAAVGPNVWNDWKGALLFKLYLKAEKILLGRTESLETYWESPKVQQVRDMAPHHHRDHAEAHIRGLGERYFAAFAPENIVRHMELLDEAQQKGFSFDCARNDETGMSEVVICTRDRSGLFADLTGTFSSQLVDVHGAALFTTPEGFVVDCFTVVDAHHRGPLTKNQASLLKRLFRGILIEGKDVRQLVDQSRRRIFALLQPRTPVTTRVQFDNDSSRTHSVIDIEAGDRTGLLFDITCAMTEAGLDIASARIVTDARRVRDSFYVTRQGSKIEEADNQEAVRSHLTAAVRARVSTEVKGG
jgi:[protein-PII] uridylyltransferase